MKKNILCLTTLLLCIAGLMSSCSDTEDIVFDHEKPAFELKADKILLEVIPPSTTNASDDIYIVGACNGLTDESVMSPARRLQMAITLSIPRSATR